MEINPSHMFLIIPGVTMALIAIYILAFLCRRKININKPLQKIGDAVRAEPDCKNCFGEGWVCENHPYVPWDDGDGCCGGAGMPCERCNPSLVETV